MITIRRYPPWKPSWFLSSVSFLVRLVFFLLYPSTYAEALFCNSQYCSNYASSCRAIYECDFGVCYDKFNFDRSSGKVRYVESGCSTEFHPSVVGKCVGDTKQGYTCACNEKSYCNYNHRQLEEPNSHSRASINQLRHLSCSYSTDQTICHQYGYGASPCNVSNRSFCSIEKTSTGDIVQEGSVDYVGYFERVVASSSSIHGEWLCEEMEYKTRWRCTCRSVQGCGSLPISDDQIDRKTPPVVCRDYDSTLIDDGSNQNRTCLGHICYAEYERTVVQSTIPDDPDSEKTDSEIKVKDVRLVLGCRNFSHPELFYGWAYNKAFGHKQKGQMFCRSKMCNDMTVQNFKNASFRLEASAARSSTITFFNMATMISVLAVTAMLSFSSG